MWLNPYTAPLTYAAVLLLVAFLAPARLSPSELIGLNLTATALYLIWLPLALLPRMRRWLRDRVRGLAAHPRDSGSNLGDAAPPGAPGRSGPGVRGSEGTVVTDAD